MSNLPDGYYLYKPDEKFGGALVRVRDGRHEILLMQGMEMLTAIRKNHIQPLRLEPVEPDAPITPEALQAAGWRLDIAGAELTLYKRYINDGWYSHVQWWLGEMSVAIGNFDDVIVTFPNCKTMSQLRALVAMLTPAD